MHDWIFNFLSSIPYLSAVNCAALALLEKILLKCHLNFW